jgi:hypothetical protein
MHNDMIADPSIGNHDEVHGEISIRENNVTWDHRNGWLTDGHDPARDCNTHGYAPPVTIDTRRTSSASGAL